jgi:tetratricopeptide (TPR) repeat protein
MFEFSHLSKGYYKEALNEFSYALEIRRKLTNNVDIATTHRFLGETLCKLEDFEQAKIELDTYHSITLKLNDIVETQRSHTTLGNYFMALVDSNFKSKSVDYTFKILTSNIKVSFKLKTGEKSI